MTTRASMFSLFFFQLLLLLIVGGSTASSTKAATLSSQHLPSANGVVTANDQNDRRLAVYALYNLDKFSVRFLTSQSDELQDARANAASADIGDQWILISETGGLESTLSYPIRTVTQEFLYIGFQNLIDNWLLELAGGPDGNNDLSYRNVTDHSNNSDGDFGGRFLQVYNLNGGDSTGEQDYNTIGNNPIPNQFNSSAATGTEIQVETATVETIQNSSSTEGNQNQQQQQQTVPTTPPDVQSSSTLDESTAVPAPNEQEPEPTQAESTLTESTPVPTPTTEKESSTNKVPSDPAAPQRQPSSGITNVYEGLVYHSMYEHLVTVDLRVKLYLRKDGLSGELDSLRRNLETDDNGQVELLAEVSPTIAFLEPVSEAKRLNKPSNADVKELFGGWMEYMFTHQRSVYLRTLHEYPEQSMLQDITTLKVDVETSPSVSAASSSSGGRTGAWSEKTQKALVSCLIILGIVALIWPMYTYGRHVKKNRQISLQILNSEEGDEYDFSNSFGSVTYRDDVEDALKLPPINPSVPAPSNFSLPRPQSMGMGHRTNSLDAMRHGQDVFPSKEREHSQKSALSALEASDRYLSRHRPDLFYDQHEAESKGTVNVFGRVYEIPSNPFEFIYKGWDQQQQQQQQQQISNNLSPAGTDLGRNAHFPFASPRSSFTARPPSVSSNPYGGRATSVGSTGSVGNANHFTPIVVPNQNLAAGMGDEENDISSAPGIAAHTGHSWQNNNNETPSSQQLHQAYSEGAGGSVIGNIFRNLSISSWYNGNSINNSYTANSQIDPELYPSPSSATEEVYYDDYHHQHKDPSLFQQEIELESLPNDEESPANYDFAFQDFPRKDGTPCLIVDDDSFLSERKRRESAKMIFSIDDEDVLNSSKDDGSLTEKKLDDIPVSDEAFKMMLSQNALAIDNSVIQLDGSDDSMVLPPFEGSFLSKDPHDAKSPEFQQKLSRLMETKQQRYTRENKNAAIIAETRKKRKNVRERERVDRHKAIERELEDIEAEFSLTMQPLSPNRNKSSASNVHGTPKRKAHSPKPPSGAGGRYSPMPSRMAASPARKNNMAALSPTRSNLTSIAANSPARSSMSSRSRGIARTNSNSNSHRRQNSLGASPFRTYNPRARYPNHSHSQSMGGDIFRGAASGEGRSASQRSSPPGPVFDVDGTDYKPKFRPTNSAHERFSGPHGVGGTSDYSDLSLPSIGGEKGTFKSPQAVIDEAMQSGKQHHYPTRHHHQRSLTPTRSLSHKQRSLTPSKMRPTLRTNSFDMSDDSFQRRVNGSSQLSTIRPSVKPNSNSNHRRARSGSIGHRRTNSIGSSHKRSNSRNDDDMFLHGVVAQTRFI